MTVNLLDFDLDGLTAFCEQLGEKRFRATQLFRWIHQRGAQDFDQMSDLAKSLRDKLKGCAQVFPLPVVSEHQSADGTVKWLFDVGAGNAVEAVFIPEDDRGTLCVSSQAGCAVGCRFCSTGHQGFSRNLTTGEIVSQLWFAEHVLRKRFQTQDRIISNVVMMGMGEPLQNYSALVPALRVMLDAFSPGNLMRRFAQYRRSHELRQKMDDAWAWQMYSNYYDELASSRQQGFEMLFNEVYAQVYDRVLREKQREPEA